MTMSDNARAAEDSSESLRDAFSQAHNAIQWLARMVRSFRNNDGGNDIVLNWDENRNAFVTDEFVDKLQMELLLPQLTLQFLEDGEPVKHELHMEGRSPAQVEAWVLVELLHRGVDRQRFSKDLPYDIPNQMIGDGVEYSPEFREGELKQIAGWFADATELLKSLDKQSASKQKAKPSLILRSKDLSLVIDIPLTGQSRTKTEERAIRVGFCPLRREAVDPHYFVTRFEPTNQSAEVIEIIKVPATHPLAIGGPETAKRIMAAITKMQKKASQ